MSRTKATDLSLTPPDAQHLSQSMHTSTHAEMCAALKLPCVLSVWETFTFTVISLHKASALKIDIFVF